MANLNILVMFGGVSAEHEVSIITGLQVVENIDKDKFNPHVLYLRQDGTFRYFPGLTSRKQFSLNGGKEAFLARDAQGPYLSTAGLISSKIRIDGSYLAFHGGNGEGGPMQGLLEVLGIPFTSPNQEAAVLTMNKELTKTMLREVGVKVVEGINVTNHEPVTSQKLDQLIEKLSLPVIIKPVHLGSSIGINVAKSKVDLEKYLSAGLLVDSEVVVEKFLQGFTEYNCSVRSINGNIETSPIERPIKHDELLSFADKYQKGGGKKTGGAGGMASLVRELPAEISPELEATIRENAKKAFIVCRCTGMVRIDFMVVGSDVYLTEINPIPGSMAYYLWEAAGISFRQQITDLIEQGIRDQKARAERRMEYKTDIVEKFVAN